MEKYSIPPSKIWISRRGGEYDSITGASPVELIVTANLHVTYSPDGSLAVIVMDSVPDQSWIDAEMVTMFVSVSMDGRTWSVSENEKLSISPSGSKK